MSLKLILKAGEKVIIGGAVIRNGHRPAEIFVENHVPILRRKDIMTETEVTTLASRVYFQIQLIYIDADRRNLHLLALYPIIEELKQVHPEQQTVIDQLVNLIDSGDYYHALKATRIMVDAGL